MTSSGELLASAEHWFLESTLFRGEALEIRIAAGVASELHDIEVLGVNAGEGRAIEVQAFSRRLSVRFRHVVAYQTYDESFSRPDKWELSGGEVLHEYSKSEYLEYLRNATYFPWVRGDRLRHFGLAFENAIVDVVAEDEPEVTQLVESMLEAEQPGR